MLVGGRKGSVFFLSCFLSFCGLAFSCYVMLLAQVDF